MNKYLESIKRIKESFGCDPAYYGLNVEFEILEEAIDKANKYDEKEKILFENLCGAFFEEHLLYEAIKQKCCQLNKYCYNKYKVYLHNGYPCVSIAHFKIRIHRLLGEFLYGEINKDFVIHHIDGNRLNNVKDNLQLISKSEHSSLHNKNKKYTPCLTAIKNARKKNFRQDITKEKCEELRKKGYTLEQISKFFNCSKNTISRRLGMKDYKIKNNIVDWSDE